MLSVHLRSMHLAGHNSTDAMQSLVAKGSVFSGASLKPATFTPHRTARPCAGALVVRAAVVGPGKKWEHIELNNNGKPVRVNMHVRLGDTVKIIAGSDKGKVGRIVEVNTKRGEVLVEGVNIKTKHIKPAAQGEQGQVVKKEFPVHHSNVAVYSTAQQVASRVGYKVVDGVKVRFLKKTGEVLPSTVKRAAESGSE